MTCIYRDNCILDSAWTEKLMGTPNVTDNYRGYEDSDLSKKAMTLDKKLLMLIHGSADETVHYQHSMMLIRALTEKGVLFRHQVRSVLFSIISYTLYMFISCRAFFSKYFVSSNFKLSSTF